MIIGGVLTVISYVVEVVILFGVYGCASTNFNKSSSSCRNLHGDQVIVKILIVGTYLGIALIGMGLIMFIVHALGKRKQSTITKL